jgi:hypothetical protein
MMDKFTDAYIRNGLRIWTAQYHPPTNGRARLFWEACRLSRQRTKRSAPAFPKLIASPNVNYPFIDLDRTFTNWSIFHHVHSGVQVLV